MKRFVKHITVSTADLDHLKHVNNVRYLEWVQQISGEHWAQLSRPEWDSRYFWVVRSHHIDYYKEALLGEELELTTFVPELKGPLSRRIVEFRRAGSDQLLVRCETQWCLIDTSTKRPCRIPEPICACF